MTSHSTAGSSHEGGPARQGLPLAGLLALASAAFITLLTEILPAGLLSAIAGGLDVSESFAGQFITAYAIGALIAAIPVTSLTRGMRRRPLLLFAIGGFALVNLVTALSNDYTVSMVARFVAGVFGGIVWSLFAGYAVRMSPPHLAGRAIAVAGTGGTIALVLGVPLGTLLGRAIGWQGAFGLMSLLSIGLIFWVLAAVPDFPGQPKAQRQSLTEVFRTTGIRGVLLIVLTFVTAHSVLYIYIEPLLQPAGLAAKVDVILFTFGIGSIIGLLIVGSLVDRHLRKLAPLDVAIFGTAALLLAVAGQKPTLVYAAVVLWGLAVGGFATITQTALSRFAGASVDVAQAMYTTGWNLAVAIGGVLGGLMLDRAGTAAFPWVVLALLVLTFVTVVGAMSRALAGRA